MELPATAPVVPDSASPPAAIPEACPFQPSRSSIPAPRAVASTPSCEAMLAAWTVAGGPVTSQEVTRYLEGWQKAHGLAKQPLVPGAHEKADDHLEFTRQLEIFASHLSPRLASVTYPPSFAEPIDAWRWPSSLINSTIEETVDSLVRAQPEYSRALWHTAVDRTFRPSANNAYWNNVRVAQWAPVLLSRHRGGAPISLPQLEQAPFVSDLFNLVTYLSSCHKAVFTKVHDVLGLEIVQTPLDLPEGLGLVEQDGKLRLGFDVSVVQEISDRLEARLQGAPLYPRYGCPAGAVQIHDQTSMVLAFQNLVRGLALHTMWPQAIQQLNARQT